MDNSFFYYKRWIIRKLVLTQSQNLDVLLPPLLRSDREISTERSSLSPVPFCPSSSLSSLHVIALIKHLTIIFRPVIFQACRPLITIQVPSRIVADNPRWSRACEGVHAELSQPCWHRGRKRGTLGVVAFTTPDVYPNARFACGDESAVGLI